MARATPKKLATAGGKPKTNDISTFFRKTPSDQAVPRKSSNGSILEDVKPNLQAQRLNGRSSRKGKEKAIGGDTSADPVVISSDDEDQPPSVAKRQRRTMVKSPSPDTAAVLPSSPGAGPSRSRSKSRDVPGRSCSPPRVGYGPTPPPEPEATRPPFAGVPDFQPPDKWPQIINTAEDLAPDDEDGDGSREDMDLDFDADSQHPGMFEEEEEDGEGEDGDSGGQEREQNVGHDSSVPAVVDVDGDEVEEIPPERPTETCGDSRGGSIDLTMEWDEGDDEGMGMEEPDDHDDPPSRSASRTGAVAGAPKGKLEKCPMCSKPMKGKASHVIEKHINSCLDTRGAKTSARPITSIGHAVSPAPTSPSPEPETPAKGPNAFSVLMSGHKEKEQWKTAEDDLRRDGKRTYGRRPAPFYKVMTGMPVAVDAFRYGAIPKVTAYLLTHAHSDHYTNLSKAWCHGPIYCSQTTANLIIHMLGVEPKWVHGLPDDVPFEMPNTGGVTVTPLTANHCPGSSLFLFEGRQTVNAGDSAIKSPYVGSKRVFRYLHCGDFRACPKMVLQPAVARARIDTCYLDTTYLNPKYCFPPQPQVIEACATLARRTVLGMSETAPPLEDAKDEIKPAVYGESEYHQERSKEMLQGWLQPVKKEEGGDTPSTDTKATMNGDGEVKPVVKDEPLVEIKPKPKGRTLVVMGTYSIGKERIVKAVAKILGSTIYCDPRKKGILLCETDPELHSMLSADPIASQVHLLPLGNIQLDRLQDYLVRLHPHFDRVLGFRPTGWSYSPPAGTDMLPDVNMVIKRDQSRTFTHAGLQPQRGSCKQYMMYGVPYSEHSSFFELTCFALSLPGPDLRMIATVNVGNERSRAKMKKWFEKWAAEKARRKEKNLPQIVDYRDETYW